VFHTKTKETDRCNEANINVQKSFFGGGGGGGERAYKAGRNNV
jgi:hypothetical protein